MKLPWVKRKQYEKLQSEVSSLESRNFCLREQLSIAEKWKDEVLPRLFRINVARDIEFETYRVCIDFHREMVERAFAHGGDDKMIQYLAGHLGEQVGRKMVQFNFARCERL